MKRRLQIERYVTAFKDRHGKERWRYRPPGAAKPLYFKSRPGEVGFAAELEAYKAGENGCEVVRRAIPGTINDLCSRYFRSQDFLGQGETTRTKNRSIIERFREQHGDKRVATITFEHIDAILAAAIQKRVGVNGREVGGRAAAKNLRKQLQRLFGHARRVGLRPDNPVEATTRVKYRTAGFHTWSEDEIAQYQRTHPLGSMARLAMELMLWTGNRRGDATELGRQHIKRGSLHLVQEKTGKPLILPVAPALLEAITAMPSSGHLTFLISEYGRPFTKAGFGKRMRKWCDEAGLPHCTSHGLRKAISRRMAEMGAGNQGIKSVTGHSGDSEVALYTRAVDQERLAERIMARLVEWEMANRPGGLANPQQETEESRHA